MSRKVRPIRIEGNIAYVPLTQGYEAVIDADFAKEIGAFNWHAKKNRGRVYACRTQQVLGAKVKIYMHRVIFGNSSAVIVDHVDNNPLNNTLRNLREATASQNLRNQKTRSDNCAGYKGVQFRKRSSRWRARIRLQGKRYELGEFDTPEQAHAAYCKASDQFHGNFGRLS